MKTYHIEVKMQITCKDGYNTSVIAESEVKQAVTIPAREVRKAATELVKQSVSNMGRSAETGLDELIKSEPVEIEAQSNEDKALSI